MPPEKAQEARPHEVTALLQAWRGGDVRAGDALLERVYDELKKIASAHLRGEARSPTLEPTSLVHEAYLRLLPQRDLDWRDRAHFFGLASTMMRRVLVDRARRRGRLKRNAGAGAGLAVTATGVPRADLIDLDRSLSELAERHPRPAKILEMRYFADLEIEEIAVCLELSAATVKRDWQFARAWLAAELRRLPVSAPGAR